MSSSEHEVDISVVSSPEPSPTGCGPDGRDSPIHSNSPARSVGASTPNSNHTPTSAHGTPNSSRTYHSSPPITAVPPTVLHHHLQHHLSTLSGGHPVALHHALHSFGHLAHPAHQHLLHPAAVTPTAGQFIATERLSPPPMAAVAPKSPGSSSNTEESQTQHLSNSNNNNSKVANNNHNHNNNNNNCGDLNNSSVQNNLLLGGNNGNNNNNSNNNNNNNNNNNKVTTGHGFTSFSISSILSRNEPAKKNGPNLITPIPHLPPATVGAGGPQDAAMLSRFENLVFGSSKDSNKLYSHISKDRVSSTENLLI
uniref:Uncharacterized protein n=1 Tax=Glossina austeni TaxID=7395 RepID=A0A1A9UEP2_GLOAU